MIFVTHRLMQMMRELVEKYPDGYEGYQDKVNLSGDVLAVSPEIKQPEISAAPDITFRMEDMSI